MSRAYYATPADLRYRPWAADVTPDECGNPPFPHDFIVNPYRDPNHPLKWQTADSDPALRFWMRPFDPNLTEWLKTVDANAISTQAALEFGSQFHEWDKWGKGGKKALRRLKKSGWLEEMDLCWVARKSQKSRDKAFTAICSEIIQLQQLMQDDRQRYLAEAESQADGTADYFIHFLGANRARHPWTIELIACAMSISHVMHMYYKHRFLRVRPSFLCPGLVPPFGPPAHPAFPSGHASQGHLIALFLLEIPALAKRYGVFNLATKKSRRKSCGKYRSEGRKPKPEDLDGRGEIDSPLLWLAQRIAKNRERIGVHYASDSSAGRHLARGVWRDILRKQRITCPTLEMVIERAKAEWPERR